MIRNASTVLAVGAAGKFAGLVIPELAKRGVTVRGLVKHKNQFDDVRHHGAAEIVVGDLTNRSSVRAALDGVDSVFYIAPAFLPNEVHVGKAMVEAARGVGVRRFVFSSVIHPVLSALENHAAKAPVEEAILTSGMEYSFLHPTVFFQNYTQSWPKVVETGVLAEPWSIDSRFSRVDYRDVAEAAAIALTEDRLLYGTFELCSEGHLDRKDVAAIIGNVLGRDIRADKIDPQTAAGGPGGQAPGLKKMFDWYDARGLKGCALTLRAVLGREPRTLRAYFEELAAESQEVEMSRVEPSSLARRGASWSM
jgi:uncharacterized protein YbjT (DUF2867 family)